MNIIRCLKFRVPKYNFSKSWAKIFPIISSPTQNKLKVQIGDFEYYQLQLSKTSVLLK